VSTTGIVETNFVEGSVSFMIVDTGGENNERKKWVQCFEGVDAVFFFVALSDYNMKLIEDNSTNRMHESLALFDEVCNSVFFMKSNMIVFFNKNDIFREKIKRVHLNVCFEDYAGPMEYEESIDFIMDKFNTVNRNSYKNIYIHTMCAIDTQWVEMVFMAVKDLLLRSLLVTLYGGI
jgi:G-protein alpha subunit